MLVAAHGDVAEYCAKHGMEIGEVYTGSVEDYNGKCLILVTDNCTDENEYYYLKYKLRKRKVELVSTHWYNGDVSSFVQYLSRREDRKKSKNSGRVPFGFRRVCGKLVEDPESIVIARRIIALRDAGYTYRRIVDADGVGYPDGRKMGISTVQVILRNRSKYE